MPSSGMYSENPEFVWGISMSAADTHVGTEGLEDLTLHYT
jgi:hypothetical protein